MLHADHELNASTFAARVAAATLTDLHSAIVGAIGALKGPLHGGANADVMRMLIEIGQDATAERVDEAIRGKLARKVKIPGFGHRVYRTEDPRATHLRRMSKELGERAGNTALVRDVAAHRDSWSPARRSSIPNVDFYSASTYYTLGHPDRSLHADLRRQPRLRLDRALPRAVRQQPPDPPAHRLHRPGVSADVPAVAVAIGAASRDLGSGLRTADEGLGWD